MKGEREGGVLGAGGPDTLQMDRAPPRHGARGTDGYFAPLSLPRNVNASRAASPGVMVRWLPRGVLLRPPFTLVFHSSYNLPLKPARVREDWDWGSNECPSRSQKWLFKPTLRALHASHRAKKPPKARKEVGSSYPGTWKNGALGAPTPAPTGL